MRLATFFVIILAALTASAGESEARATFSMYCYWTGEATLGRVEGVRQTRIGHIPGEEIVEVVYDPEKATLEELVEALKRERSFYAIVARTDDERRTAAEVVPTAEIIKTNREPHFIESKHSLRSRYPQIWALGLSEEQAIALNSWAFFGGKMPDVLTEEQKARLERGTAD